MAVMENRTLAEIAIGDCASLTRTISSEDILAYAALSGDFNPIHVDEDFARDHVFRHRIAHGHWAGMLISAVVGTQLPGPGSVFISQTMEFRRPIGVGDTLTATVTVREKARPGRTVVLDCRVTNQSGETVADGTARVAAPRRKIVFPLQPRPRLALSAGLTEPLPPAPGTLATEQAAGSEK